MIMSRYLSILLLSIYLAIVVSGQSEDQSKQTTQAPPDESSTNEETVEYTSDNSGVALKRVNATLRTNHDATDERPDGPKLEDGELKSSEQANVKRDSGSRLTFRRPSSGRRPHKTRPATQSNKISIDSDVNLATSTTTTTSTTQRPTSSSEGPTSAPEPTTSSDTTTIAKAPAKTLKASSRTTFAGTDKTTATTNKTTIATKAVKSGRALREFIKPRPLRITCGQFLRKTYLDGVYNGKYPFLLQIDLQTNMDDWEQSGSPPPRDIEDFDTCMGSWITPKHFITSTYCINYLTNNRTRMRLYYGNRYRRKSYYVDPKNGWSYDIMSHETYNSLSLVELRLDNRSAAIQYRMDGLRNVNVICVTERFEGYTIGQTMMAPYYDEKDGSMKEVVMSLVECGLNINQEGVLCAKANFFVEYVRRQRRRRMLKVLMMQGFLPANMGPPVVGSVRGRALNATNREYWDLPSFPSTVNIPSPNNSSNNGTTIINNYYNTNDKNYYNGMKKFEQLQLPYGTPLVEFIAERWVLVGVLTKPEARYGLLPNETLEMPPNVFYFTMVPYEPKRKNDDGKGYVDYGASINRGRYTLSWARDNKQ